MDPNPVAGCITLEAALALRAGKRLAFTNGVFDLFHAGHVDSLEAAAAHGDLLIVGLNSDASARGLGKGDDRPLVPLVDRARVIGALRCVTAVVSFDDPTPIRLIEALRPEVHVKGGDYDPDRLPETPVIRAYGGQVVIVPLRPERSTTALLAKIRGA
ncbi:MAG: adenylyltransferase/cytidyltransferase family protein [Fimbriimonadaceae bacterium]|nr:adenylyltransferase/cytidyltransferase family protein [Fimbriimonadaceae bacterium]